jgi:hypothetical protein
VIAGEPKALKAERKKLKAFLSWMRRNRPSTIAKLRQSGQRLRLAGAGAFRQGWIVCGLGIVVKLPIRTLSGKSVRENVQHSRNEIDFLKKVRKSKVLKPLLRYLPTVLYSDRKSGVIAMPRYSRATDNRFTYMAGEAFMNMIQDIIPLRWQMDFHPMNNNLGRKRGCKGYSIDDYMILDLGLVSRAR